MRKLTIRLSGRLLPITAFTLVMMVGSYQLSAMDPEYILQDEIKHDMALFQLFIKTSIDINPRAAMEFIDKLRDDLSRLRAMLESRSH